MRQSAPAAAYSRRSVSRPSEGKSLVYNGEIYIGQLESKTADFELTALNVNPGLSSFSPWMAGVAKNFQFYVLNGVTLTYRPRVSTAQSGAIYMAFEPNVDDALPDSLDLFNQIDGAKSVSVWDKGLALHVPRKSLMAGMSKRFIRSDSQDISDLDKYDAGRLLYGSSGYVGVLGEIWMKISVVCTVPQPVVATVPQSKNNVSHYRNVAPIPDTGASASYTPLQFPQPLQEEAASLVSNSTEDWAATADPITVLEAKEDVTVDTTVEVPLEVVGTTSQVYLDAWLDPDSPLPQLIQSIIYNRSVTDFSTTAGFLTVAIPLVLKAGQKFGFTLRSSNGNFYVQPYAMRLVLAVARLVGKTQRKFTSLTTTSMAEVAKTRGLPWPVSAEDKSPRSVSSSFAPKEESKVSSKIRKLQKELEAPPPLARR